MSHRILVCADTYPYPGDRGDRVRYGVFLEALRNSYEVELVLLRRAAEAAERPAPGATDMTFGRTDIALNLARGVFGSVPAQFSGFRSAEAKRAISGLARHADAFVGLGARAGTYRSAAHSIPGLLDLQDSLVLNARSQWKGAAGLPRRLYGADAILKAVPFEKKLVRSFDVVTVAGPADRDAVSRRNLGIDCRVIPSAVPIVGETIDPRANDSRVLFLGDLRFAPNADAVMHLVEEIWPRVERLHPQARLAVVGHEPRRALRGKLMGSGHQCAFSVPDTTPHLRSSKVFVAPMQLGSGIKVKVLHAMAHGVPVVMSELANQGIGATHDVDALIADDPPTFAASIVRLLEDDPLALRLGLAGRALVRDRFDPASVSALFLEAVEDVIGKDRSAARDG